jgi:hypothetical protein
VPKPTVLVFIDWYLPGYKAGGPVRSLANLVDHLRDRIDFHIVTTDTRTTPSAPYADITPDTMDQLPGGEKVWYASRVGTLGETCGKQLLGRENWDTVYINGMYSCWFSILPLWLLRGIEATEHRGCARHARQRYDEARSVEEARCSSLP